MNRFIQIDEEGYLTSQGQRLSDPAYGHEVLKNIVVSDRGFATQYQGAAAIVEAFNEPYVAVDVLAPMKSSLWQILLPYEVKMEFDLNSLVLDEWDRFVGRTSTGVPFVFSRSAQMQFFDLMDSFDDESITYGGQKIELLSRNQYDKQTEATKGDVNSAPFWDSHYTSWKSTGARPGWELGEVAKPLTEVLPQIKLPKSRICILGCGTGHDAAFLARQGHLVTAVDLSSRAIEEAKKLYGEIPQLKFIENDAFQFAEDHAGEFDIVFEHTFFCAVDPDRRNELVKVWRKLLAPRGHLLGIFFAMDHGFGPPFGASEWTVREHLKNSFQFLYWTRWKTSMPQRLGKELVIYAQKK